jgi:hypothetical protein
MNNIQNKDDYNHISIFMFMLPLIRSYLLDCDAYLCFNSIFLVVGFAYHYSLYIFGNNNICVKMFRILDMVSIHTLIPYMVYSSFFYNMYFFMGIMCIILLIIIYYIYPYYKGEIPHFIIHIIAGIGVYYSINSCYLNKELCSLCSSNY